jgi:hypothetical protein
MRRLFIISAAALWVTASSAQELSLWDKLALQKACSADLETLCGTVERGEGRILQCVNQNAEKLSAECSRAVAHYKDQVLVTAQ